MSSKVEKSSFFYLKNLASKQVFLHPSSPVFWIHPVSLLDHLPQLYGHRYIILLRFQSTKQGSSTNPWRWGGKRRGSLLFGNSSISQHPLCIDLPAFPLCLLGRRASIDQLSSRSIFLSPIASSRCLDITPLGYWRYRLPPL